MSQLAVQLYTVRDHTATESDLVATLEKIAAIGYRAVQVSAVTVFEAGAVSAQRLRTLLDDHGLACIATHRGWDDLADRTDDELALHAILGCDYVAIGGLPRAYESAGAAGYARFVDDAVPVIARLKAGGLRFGYHNHAHEFRRAAEGATPSPRLFDTFLQADPDFLLELDLYWAWHAGVDPAELVRESTGRVPVIHLKDKEVVAGDGPVIAAIGEGNLPWDRIIPACQTAGVDWYCIEQDTCRRDPFDCLASSYRYLSERFGL
jgi:sugar phosphate isomerase/epimerase